jgi:hypothetical protein
MMRLITNRHDDGHVNRRAKSGFLLIKQNKQNSVMSHTFHIPVLGLGYSVDTPIKVSRFGISSVASIVDDELIERMRKKYYLEQGETYIPIGKVRARLPQPADHRLPEPDELDRQRTVCRTPQAAFRAA